MTHWVFNDGGRAAAGYKGTTSDCVARAIAIASNIPYQAAYDLVNEASKASNSKRKSSARTGVQKDVTKALLAKLGWTWVPTMLIGQGCKVHLKASELPTGRIIVSVSKHLVAVIDGVIHDTYDPGREGNRCVYGYWTKA